MWTYPVKFDRNNILSDASRMTFSVFSCSFWQLAVARTRKFGSTTPGSRDRLRWLVLQQVFVAVRQDGKELASQSVTPPRPRLFTRKKNKYPLPHGKTRENAI